MITRILRTREVKDEDIDKYDKKVEEYWKEITKIKRIGPIQKTILKLPMTYGGMAAGLMRNKREAAFIGSWVGAMDTVRAAPGGGSRLPGWDCDVLVLIAWCFSVLKHLHFNAHVGCWCSWLLVSFF